MTVILNFFILFVYLVPLLNVLKIFSRIENWNLKVCFIWILNFNFEKFNLIWWYKILYVQSAISLISWVIRRVVYILKKAQSAYNLLFNFYKIIQILLFLINFVNFGFQFLKECGNWYFNNIQIMDRRIMNHYKYVLLTYILKLQKLRMIWNLDPLINIQIQRLIPYMQLLIDNIS